MSLAACSTRSEVSDELEIRRFIGVKAKANESLYRNVLGLLLFEICKLIECPQVEG